MGCCCINRICSLLGDMQGSMLRADNLDVPSMLSVPAFFSFARSACRIVASYVQALICVALGLPPTFFRRLVQSNGATSVLDFMPPRGGGAPTIMIDRLNQVKP